MSGTIDANAILVFAKVVEAGSFVGASKALDMPTSTVSRKVSELEARLGARLLQRTTRSLSLTDEGRIYYAHAARVAAEVEEAELAVDRMQEAPRGRLRVTVPLNFGFLAPAFASYLARYPEVELEVVGADRLVDLVHEGFDVAVRAGGLADSTLVARRLGDLQSFLVASPRFLERAGAPEAPRDLESTDCLVFGAGELVRWRLVKEDEELTVDVRARLIVNDFDFLEQAARAGLGIAMLPAFRCVAHGGLSRVLPAWRSPAIPIHAVYPSTRHLSPKVKTFLDHLQAEMSPPPWERGPRP